MVLKFSNNVQISETTFCYLTLFHLSYWWWSIPYLIQPWLYKQTFAVAEVRLKWCFLNCSSCTQRWPRIYRSHHWRSDSHHVASTDCVCCDPCSE